eukprot:1874920-Lingulodinium_polyedra.AAC.1
MPSDVPGVAPADGSALAAAASAAASSPAAAVVPEQDSMSAAAAAPAQVMVGMPVLMDRCMHLQHRTSNVRNQ